MMNSKQRASIASDRGRLEKMGYRFLTAVSAADGLIVQVNYDRGGTPLPIGTVARLKDAIAWREALDLAAQHNAGSA